MPPSEIPEYLKLSRQGAEPDPPVETSAQLLPIGRLLWEDFERLCYRLALLEGEPEHAQLFGTRGQDQSGIDIYSRMFVDSYVTYQCKRYETFKDDDVAKAVAKFLKDEWAEKSQRFVLCTSHSMVRRQRATAIEKAAKDLSAHEPNSVAFDVWDAEALSVKLKSHPDLVREFFGPAWLERFLPGSKDQELSAQLSAMQERLEELVGSKSYLRTRLVTLDWAPERLKVELERLHEERPEMFELFVEHVGMPPDPRLLRPAVEAVPPWLEEADAWVWELVARSAESLGEWLPASAAWERVGERQGTDGQVRSLMAAAAAAGVGGDEPRQDMLVSRAREIGPEHPRVALQDVPQDIPGPEQLPRLLELRPENPDDRALVAGRLALAYVLVPDLDGARQQLRDVDEYAPGSAMSKGLAVTIKVQEGRLALLAGRPLDGQGLRQTQLEALAVRDRLIRERRWEESARLLMLAADAICLLGERGDAAGLLREAQPLELQAPTGAIVLADAAASRALDFRLGLQLLGDRNESPVERRIRAECLEAVGTAPERTAALATLDALIEEGSDEAAEASFIRLAATLGGRHVPWSDAAERFLRDHDFERAVVVARGMYLIRWHAAFDDAEALLAPHLHEPWAKIARLRFAMNRGRYSLIKQAADDLMASGPTQVFRLEAGRGYGMARELPRAKEVLMGVARDQSAPRQARVSAYQLLMRVVGAELGDWELALQLHKEWVELAPGSPAASQWGPMVARRGRATGSEGR
jgi:hypothetical protein